MKICRILQNTHTFACAFFKRTLREKNEKRRQRWWGTGEALVSSIEFVKPDHAEPWKGKASLLQTWQNGTGLASNGERLWGPPHSWSLKILDLEMGGRLANFPDVLTVLLPINQLPRFSGSSQLYEFRLTIYEIVKKTPNVENFEKFKKNHKKFIKRSSIHYIWTDVIGGS